MPKSTTLNRFPLFGLFAHEAAKKMGYPEDDARLLGYSTALLYAIFKAKAQAKKERRRPHEEGTAHGDRGQDEDASVRRARFPSNLWERQPAQATRQTNPCYRSLPNYARTWPAPPRTLATRNLQNRPEQLAEAADCITAQFKRLATTLGDRNTRSQETPARLQRAESTSKIVFGLQRQSRIY